MSARAGGGGPGSKRSAAPWAEKLNRDGISQSEPVSTGSELEALRRRGRSSGCSGRGEKRRERRRRRREPGSPRPGGGEAAGKRRLVPVPGSAAAAGGRAARGGGEPPVARSLRGKVGARLPRPRGRPAPPREAERASERARREPLLLLLSPGAPGRPCGRTRPPRLPSSPPRWAAACGSARLGWLGGSRGGGGLKFGSARPPAMSFFVLFCLWNSPGKAQGLLVSVFSISISQKY